MGFYKAHNLSKSPRGYSIPKLAYIQENQPHGPYDWCKFDYTPKDYLLELHLFEFLYDYFKNLTGPRTFFDDYGQPTAKPSIDVRHPMDVYVKTSGDVHVKPSEDAYEYMGALVGLNKEVASDLPRKVVKEDVTSAND